MQKVKAINIKKKEKIKYNTYVEQIHTTYVGIYLDFFFIFMFFTVSKLAQRVSYNISVIVLLKEKMSLSCLLNHSA